MKKAWKVVDVLFVCLLVLMVSSIPQACTDSNAQTNQEIVDDRVIEFESDLLFDEEGYLEISEIEKLIKPEKQNVDAVYMIYVVDGIQLEITTGNWFYVPRIGETVYYRQENKTVVRNRLVTTASGFQLFEVYIF